MSRIGKQPIPVPAGVKVDIRWSAYSSYRETRDA